nr:MAG TPA: hypothetical protein [Bacteriophage sp.]
MLSYLMLRGVRLKRRVVLVILTQQWKEGAGHLLVLPICLVGLSHQVLWHLLLVLLDYTIPFLAMMIM